MSPDNCMQSYVRLDGNFRRNIFSNFTSNAMTSVAVQYGIHYITCNSEGP